jgi:hypothetical protein
MARQRGPEVADKRYLSETTLALLQPASDAGDQSVAIPAAITASRRYHGIVKPTEPQAKHQLDLHHSQGRDQPPACDKTILTLG